MEPTEFSSSPLLPYRETSQVFEERPQKGTSLTPDPSTPTGLPLPFPAYIPNPSEPPKSIKGSNVEKISENPSRIEQTEKLSIDHS